LKKVIPVAEDKKIFKFINVSIPEGKPNI